MIIYSLVIILCQLLTSCSMSGSNCCFLICIQVSQEMVRWSGIPISLYIDLEFLGYMETICLNFEKIPKCFPKRLNHFIVHWIKHEWIILYSFLSLIFFSYRFTSSRTQRACSNSIWALLYFICDNNVQYIVSLVLEYLEASITTASMVRDFPGR